MTLTERPPKLTNDHRKVLCELYEGNMTVADLARAIGEERGIAGGFLNTLRKKGLVEIKRRRSTPDNTYENVWGAV